MLNNVPRHDKKVEDISYVPYASVTRILMYVMVCIRPDIAHAMGVSSIYMSKPKKEHWEIVKMVFKYLHGTLHYAIYYQGKN
jgi:hypothetical protein